MTEAPPPTPPVPPQPPFQIDAKKVALARRAAREQLWRRGLLDFKFHDTQLKIYKTIKSSRDRRHFLLCSRRLGKSFMLVTMAFELAITKPGARILYLAPLANKSDEISSDIAAQVLEDCPADLKPEFKSLTKEFHFRNGSVIRLRGTNNEHAQYLRGGAADLVILDEAGLMDDFRHVLYDIVEPMTLTTNGQILIATTPPRSPDHESVTVLEQFFGYGSVSKYTIRDAPHLTHEQKVRTLLNCGEDPNRIEDILAGKAEPHTTTAQREYFCELVTDAASAVVPEFDSKARLEIVKEHPRPAHFDAYVSMDPGMKDRTGILYGYWDFLRCKLVIEDEHLLNHPNTPEIAKAIREKEQLLWGIRQPYMRVSDVELRLIADLDRLHGLKFQKARKDDSLAAINLMRTMVHNRDIVIDPRCTNLVRQLTNVTWNNKATDFARAGGDSEDPNHDAHYDLVAALKYLCRSINRTHNPYPANWWQPGGGGGVAANSWISPKGRKKKDSLGLHANTPFGRRIAKKK